MRSSVWRLILCGLLLTWIFHSIFVNEAQAAWSTQSAQWADLSRLQQWKIAWSWGPGKLLQTLSAIPLPHFALSLLLVGASLFLGILRWQRVLHLLKLHVPWIRTLEISLVAHFFNSFLLGSTGGDVMKAYYVARETHHLKTEAITTVLVDRFLGLLSMLAFALLFFLPNRPWIFQNDQILSASWALLLVFLIGLLLTWFAFRGGLSLWIPKARSLLRKLPFGERLENVLNSCRTFGHHPALILQVLTWSMLLNFAIVLQFLVLARGLDIPINLLALLFIVPTIICISALPITPSGLGVRENLFVLTLASPALQVDPTKALSLSLLAYLGSLFWSLLGGVVYLTFKHELHLDSPDSAESEKN